MTVTVQNKTDEQGRFVGTYRAIRSDAIKHNGRYIVPTSEATKWVGTWEEFRAAGGQICFCEDKTEIELLLPEPYKFGCGFPGDK